jgi:hypothetical protein
MPDKITVKIDGKLYTYDSYDAVPKQFDHLIAYEPEIPPPPHTEEQHKHMENFGNILNKLLEREKK